MFDPAPYRKLFPISDRLAYFNHAGVSPLNTRAAEAMRSFVETTVTESAGDYFPRLLQQRVDLLQRLATLVNARSADELVPVPNTAYGINAAALSLPLRPGDNVLVVDGDYPANIYPWMNLAHRGVLTKVVPQDNGGLNLERLVARIDSRTRVIAISTVMFATGFRNPIDEIGRICKERGIYFVVDCIQSLGAFPLDVQASGIDVLSCGSQKWLLGPTGAGFMYMRKELLDDLVPGAYVGTLSTVDPLNFLDYNFSPQPSAARFAIGTDNSVGYVGLAESVALIQEVGPETIGKQILGLVDTLIDDLGERGYRFSASTAPEHRSGIVIVEVDDPAATTARLREAGIAVIPRGKGFRVAPHFYNTREEMLRVGEVLDGK
jgi:cysteine desulfurase / selenocysteine lyase